MKRSVTIIGLMGIIGMVLISMLGASYISKVGGADAIPGLREDLLLRHGVAITDEDPFRVRPLQEGEGEERLRGMLVRFRPIESILTIPGRLEDRMRMIASHVYSKPKWANRLDFVEVVFGDGVRTTTRRMSATDLPAFGSETFTIPFDATGQAWVRFAAWDSAGNGAMTMPIRLGGR